MSFYLWLYTLVDVDIFYHKSVRNDSAFYNLHPRNKDALINIVYCAVCVVTVVTSITKKDIYVIIFF